MSFDAEQFRRSSRATAAIAAIAVLVASCNVVRPGRTPKATFESARRAILEENYEGLWRLVGERARDAEATNIAQQQREVEKRLKNMTPTDIEKFFEDNGVKPDEFINLTPAQAFAAQVKNTARVAEGLREALLDSSVLETSIDGDDAKLTVSIPGETTAVLTLAREHGMWVVPSMADFFAAVRLSGRMRKPGNTPQETYDALMACVSGRDYEPIWDLFAPSFQSNLAETFTRSIDEVKKLDDDQRRQFERTYGVSVDDYVKMGPEKLLALNLRVRFKDSSQIETVLSRKVNGVAVSGNTAVLSLSGSGGKSQVRLKRHGDKWYLIEF